MRVHNCSDSCNVVVNSEPQPLAKKEQEKSSQGERFPINTASGTVFLGRFS